MAIGARDALRRIVVQWAVRFVISSSHSAPLRVFYPRWALNVKNQHTIAGKWREARQSPWGCAGFAVRCPIIVTMKTDISVRISRRFFIQVTIVYSIIVFSFLRDPPGYFGGCGKWAIKSSQDAMVHAPQSESRGQLHILAQLIGGERLKALRQEVGMTGIPRQGKVPLR